MTFELINVLVVQYKHNTAHCLFTGCIEFKVKVIYMQSGVFARLRVTTDRLRSDRPHGYSGCWRY